MTLAILIPLALYLSWRLGRHRSTADAYYRGVLDGHRHGYSQGWDAGWIRGVSESARAPR